MLFLNYYFLQHSAPSFHMPKDLAAPLILVGPGTGIAPFRGFWHHRSQQAKMDTKGKKLGNVILFFGCRNRGLDLYKDEKEKAISEGVLSQSLIAYSREDNIDKVSIPTNLYLPNSYRNLNFIGNSK